jgi:hypothetical protein
LPAGSDNSAVMKLVTALEIVTAEHKLHAARIARVGCMKGQSEICQVEKA